MIRDIFNESRDPLLMRLAPQPPKNLADKIIMAAHAQDRAPDKAKPQTVTHTQAPNNFGLLLFIPRPAMVMSLLFVLSVFAGMQFDMGFNIPEDALMSEQDILFSFDEDNL